MSNRKARDARRAANEYASREKLWDKGIMPARSRWSRFLDLFPRHRAKTMNQELTLRGKWYKWALKKLSKQAAARMRDPDYAEMSRVQKKLAKQRVVKARFVQAGVDMVRAWRKT